MSTTSAKKCPVTKIRRPAIAAGSYIDEPGIPRASCAVSSEATHGSENYSAEFSDFVRPPRLSFTSASVLARVKLTIFSKLVRPPAARAVLGPRW